MEQASLPESDTQMLRNLTAALREHEATHADAQPERPPVTNEQILRAMLGRPLHDRPAGVRKAG